MFQSLVYLTVWAAAAQSPFENWTTHWRQDPVWHDGQAECAVYDATRTIYGQPRHYQARAYTNREHASPKTFTKSDHARGRAVFKQHWREDIPTENYVYHYSTMCYVGVDDLKSLKIDVGTQEDCGASFKQVINHLGTLTWTQHAYFPGEGHRAGEFAPTENLVFFNALPTVLRGYPFDQPPDKLPLAVVDDQTSTRWSPVQPRQYVLRYAGRVVLDMPVGRIETHQLTLFFAGPTRESRPPVHLWFAADPAWRHILVRYEAPGIEYALRSVERRAYWAR